MMELVRDDVTCPNCGVSERVVRNRQMQGRLFSRFRGARRDIEYICLKCGCKYAARHYGLKDSVTPQDSTGTVQGEN